MRVVVATDSFKGVLDAPSAARAMANGVRQAVPGVDIDLAPMADGGEGTLDVLVDAASGRRRRLQVSGPLGDPTEVSVGLIHHASTAVVELASAVGYTLIPAERRNPLKTSTFGLGEVLRAAIESDIENIILALGGSATVDGGTGLMQALGMMFVDRAGREIPPPITGGDLVRIHRYLWVSPPENIENIQFTIACDVLNPACGPNGAATVFGPQKGADAAGVEILDRGLSHWADLLENTCRCDIRNEPGTGAAGGVAMPLIALTDAALVPGVDLVSEAVGLATMIGNADLVLTGEGRLDRQSLMGKVVGAVGRMCKAADVPCVAIVGTTGDGADACLDVIDRYEALDAPLPDTESRLIEAAARLALEML